MMQPRPRIAAADPPPFAPVALTIQCGGEWFGLPISHVYTVFHIGVVTPVPLAPADILGLTNLRGLIVTVVSLRGRLGMPVRPLSEESLAVAVRHAGENYALLVDRVADVVDLAGEPPHSEAASSRPKPQRPDEPGLPPRGAHRPDAGRGRPPDLRGGPCPLHVASRTLKARRQS